MDNMNTNMQKPVILREGRYRLKDVGELKRSRSIFLIRDIYDSQLAELFKVIYPAMRTASDRGEKLLEFMESRRARETYGDWIYFPWSGLLMHTVGEEDFFTLRTNRNKNLVSEDEQRKLAGFTVGVVGLSIGSGMAIGLAYSGISNAIKIAEFDSLDTTNLNRLRSGLPWVGLAKLQATTSQVYEINPYAEIVDFPKGLKKENLGEFFAEPRPRLIFEAIDDFEMKIRIRLAARDAKVPVIMFTNLGDSILIDIERYDLDNSLPIFNGLIGNVPEEILSGPISESDKQRYAVSIVGRENVPPRAMASLLEIGKTLVGRPQLFGTVTISGGIAPYLARKIALGEELASGRKLVKFDEVFVIK